ncbi:MAG: hypothetical protein LBS11_01230 [Oscillospiraceae bacterium]|jgi:hypothetical protein|nr:hypothetical protein [Oscillospiraceae bacterium]
MQSSALQADRLIGLCDDILGHLAEAQRQLSSAKNWGLLDIFGGGALVTFIKHRKVDNCHARLDAANGLLQQLGNELKQVGQPGQLYIEAGDFAYFADYFFDGLFADLYFQNKIGELRRQVDEVYERVEKVRDALVKARAFARSQ